MDTWIGIYLTESFTAASFLADSLNSRKLHQQEATQPFDTPLNIKNNNNNKSMNKRKEQEFFSIFSSSLKNCITFPFFTTT